MQERFLPSRTGPVLGFSRNSLSLPDTIVKLPGPVRSNPRFVFSPVWGVSFVVQKIVLVGLGWDGKRLAKCNALVLWDDHECWSVMQNRIMSYRITSSFFQSSNVARFARLTFILWFGIIILHSMLILYNWNTSSVNLTKFRLDGKYNVLLLLINLQRLLQLTRSNLKILKIWHIQVLKNTNHPTWKILLL